MLANIPATQTVIEIAAPGGPEMLMPATRPVPEPKDGEVLIRIAAAGVNRADCLCSAWGATRCRPALLIFRASNAQAPWSRPAMGPLLGGSATRFAR